MSALTRIATPAARGLPPGLAANLPAAPAIAELMPFDGCGECGLDLCACPGPDEVASADLIAALDDAATDLLWGEGAEPIGFDLAPDPDPATLAVHRRVALPDGVDLDELLNAAQGPALDAFIARRIEALKQGKDRAHDRDAAPHFLAHLARDRLITIVDQLRSRDLQAARRNAEIAGALLLALWDRIEGEEGR